MSRETLTWSLPVQSDGLGRNVQVKRRPNQKLLLLECRQQIKTHMDSGTNVLFKFRLSSESGKITSNLPISVPKELYQSVHFVRGSNAFRMSNVSHELVYCSPEICFNLDGEFFVSFIPCFPYECCERVAQHRLNDIRGKTKPIPGIRCFVTSRRAVRFSQKGMCKSPRNLHKH